MLNRKILISTASFLLILIVGTYLWAQQRYIQSTDNAYIESDISHLSVKVPGYITQIFVKDNQYIKKGQILAKLENNQYKSKVIESKASLNNANAVEETLVSKIKLQQALIAQAQAKIDAASSKLNLANLQLSRTKKLSIKKYSSQSDVDLLQEDKNFAEANLRQSKSVLIAKKAELDVYFSQQIEAAAKVEQVQAILEQAKIKLEDTNIRAPFSGFIGKRGAKVGQYVQPGQSLFSLVPDKAVWIIANFKETQIQDIHADQSVNIKIDAYPDEEFHGVVESISPGSGSSFSLLPAENATGNFTKIVQRISVKILLERIENNVKIVTGSSVVVKVNTEPFDKNPEEFATRL